MHESHECQFHRMSKRRTDPLINSVVADKDNESQKFEV